MSESPVQPLLPLLAGPVLVFARCFGFMLPFTNGRLSLRMHETVLAAAAVACGAYARNASCGPLAMPAGSLAVATLSEIVAGVILGLVFAMALEVPAIAGRMIDTFRGALVTEQLLPGQELRASPLEAMASWLTPAAALSLGWHLPLLDLLYGSFSAGGDEIAAAGNLERLSLTAARISQHAVARATLFAAPLLIAMFIADAVAAAVSRMLPRLNIHAELAGARLVLGLWFGFELLAGTLTP